MKLFFSLMMLFFVIAGCKTAAIIPKVYSEKSGSLPRMLIQQGIPVFAEGIQYKYLRNGKTYLNIGFEKPSVVAVADKAYGWGYFQFPVMGKMNDGSIIAQWNLTEDNITDYGKNTFGTARSFNNGKTWQQLQKFDEPYGGVITSNGDRIAVYTPKPIKVTDINLPDSIRYLPEFYNSNSGFTLYRTKYLPDALNGIWINRAQKDDKKWILEKSKLVDENSLRYSLNGLFPVIWWGQMQRERDGNIYTCTYPGNRLNENGQPFRQPGIDCYMSADNGKTWIFQGYINYTFDKSMDTNGSKRSGFTEPGFEILQDGTFVCVMRTTDGYGHGPMYISYSLDKGKNWTVAKAITPSGVLPKLLQLKNGILVMSTGRPGVQLLFSADNGKTWTEAFEMLDVPVSDQWSYTCGYTEIVPTGKDSFLIIYSNFKYQTDNKTERKAIITRNIIVKK